MQHQLKAVTALSGLRLKMESERARLGQEEEASLPKVIRRTTGVRFFLWWSGGRGSKKKKQLMGAEKEIAELESEVALAER
eukprot:5848514-Amphidinium_carterae.1